VLVWSSIPIYYEVSQQSQKVKLADEQRINEILHLIFAWVRAFRRTCFMTSSANFRKQRHALVEPTSKPRFHGPISNLRIQPNRRRFLFDASLTMLYLIWE
jgi:hypothetical protein